LIEAVMSSDDAARAVSEIRAAVTNEVLDEGVRDLIAAAYPEIHRAVVADLEVPADAPNVLTAEEARQLIDQAPEFDTNEEREAFHDLINRLFEWADEETTDA